MLELALSLMRDTHGCIHRYQHCKMLRLLPNTSRLHVSCANRLCIGTRYRHQIAEEQARRVLQDAESATRLLQKAEKAVREAVEQERAGEKEGQQAQFVNPAALLAAPTGRRSTGILQRAGPPPSARSMVKGRNSPKAQQLGDKQATTFRVRCSPWQLV